MKLFLVALGPARLSAAEKVAVEMQSRSSSALRHGARCYCCHAEGKTGSPDRMLAFQQLLMIHRDASQPRIWRREIEITLFLLPLHSHYHVLEGNIVATKDGLGTRERSGEKDGIALIPRAGRAHPGERPCDYVIDY